MKSSQFFSHLTDLLILKEELGVALLLVLNVIFNTIPDSISTDLISINIICFLRFYFRLCAFFLGVISSRYFLDTEVHFYCHFLHIKYFTVTYYICTYICFIGTTFGFLGRRFFSFLHWIVRDVLLYV